MDTTYMPPGLASLQFADLIAPIAQPDFLSSILGKKPIHIPGNPDKFTFAMSWDLMNAVLNQSGIWTTQTLQLVLDKVVLRPDLYGIEGTGRDGGRSQSVDFNKVRALIRQGASLVLNEIETLTPGMKRIAEILGRTPGGKVQANLYCSWQKHQAFDVHYDTHDVFAMQVSGEKAWRIYQRHFKDPINHPAFKMRDTAFHHANKGPLLMEFTMRPGDLVYIPRGFYHEALAESDSTVHMSFSIVSMIGLDVLTMLFEHGVMDEAFRQSVPQPDERDGAALNEYLMRLAGRMREILRDPKVRAQLEAYLRTYTFQSHSIKLPDDSGKA
jgi:bifunctional lysine-specific demethylase and histidyl-hydroxylase MINA